MLNKFKKIIFKTDQFLYKKFGSDKSIKILQNIKEAQTIFSNLNEIGKETKVRFVGGCVRKALCGENADDIDLATSLTPDEIKKKLIGNDIRIIDTGLSHGTVTAILNKKKFEITTLRKDISTDGRHANVEFTSDWEQDASRRDFTINAIYADIEGRIFDPLNGITDLQKGIVKFIGLPEKRIQEDYLRILRYFRFFTQYSKIDHDQSVIRSIKKNINGLNKISNERIFDELKKILALKRLLTLFANQVSKDIIVSIFPQFKYSKRLEAFEKFNSKLKDKFNSILILSLLLIDGTNDFEYFCHKYKVSNDIKIFFKYISINFESLKSKKFYSETNIKKLAYLSNKTNVEKLLLFSICENKNIKSLNIESILDFINNYEIPKFPVSGNYLKEHGYKAGPILGNKLKHLETKWVENDFVLDRKIIEKYLTKNEKT